MGREPQPVANTIGGGGLLVVHHPGAAAGASIDYRYESAEAATPPMFERVDDAQADRRPIRYGAGVDRGAGRRIFHRVFVKVVQHMGQRLDAALGRR